MAVRLDASPLQTHASVVKSRPIIRLTWLVTQEDELYDMQFGEAFAAQALNPNDRRNVMRDDYALEIAGACAVVRCVTRCVADSIICAPFASIAAGSCDWFQVSSVGNRQCVGCVCADMDE